MCTTRLLLAVMLLAPTLTARASDKAVLIELEQRSAALPAGVSASGAVVVGALGTGGGFYWMPTTGVIFIGGLGASKREPRRQHHRRKGDRLARHPGRDLAARGGVEVARLVRPGAAPCDTSLSGANDTSRDGRVVVGYAL